MPDETRQTSARSAPLRIKDLLGAVADRLGIAGAVELGRLWTSWAEVVGPSVAAHTEPTSLREGVLRVRTDSPAWATEIGYMANEIATSANRVAGRAVVNEVRVWSGPGSTRPVGQAPVQPGRPGSAGPGRDDDPTRALERARRAWAKRRRSRR